MSAVGPEVSVILPVYNGERFLREAMESLLSQTFPDFEVVAVDDGSTDRSRAILEEYALKDGRVRVISRLNTGVVGALNDALRAARGSLVARMDADDVCLPRRLQAQTRFLREHPDYVLVGGRIIMMDPDGIPIREECPPRDHEEIDARHLRGEFRSAQHGRSAAGVNGEHLNVQSRSGCNGFGNGVWNVVEFQVEEQGVSRGPDPVPAEANPRPTPVPGRGRRC